MRLRSDAVATHIKQRGLPRMILVTGDEPLQKRETTDVIRAAAKAAGVEERLQYDTAVGIDWDELLQSAQAMSLFASRRLFEINLHGGKLGRDGGSGLVAVLEALGDDDTLLLTADKLDRTSASAAWYKAVDKLGAVVQVWPVSPKELPQWLVRRSAAAGLKLAGDAAAFIADRVEGNMLAAAQELEKLQLLTAGPALSIKDVMGAVVDSARYDVFSVVDEALAGNAARALRMLRGLREEGTEPVLVSWTVNRELRLCCAMRAAVDGGQQAEQVMEAHRVFDNRRRAVGAALRRHRLARWHDLLLASFRIDKAVKGLAAGDPWRDLEWLLLALADASDQLPLAV
ncbi:MAG: DNA polymerase III subunit delta [Gammaproteobacteria bacterium]|nr:DNA polymerase III subunit delta [Gammaproteobacteria bacterium]